MVSKLLLLKKQADISAVDINKRIICQKSQTAELTSTENGLNKVIEAVHIRNDIVRRRLQDPTVEENFKYHMTNTCYKSYTMKKTLDAIMAGIFFFLHVSFIFLYINFLLLHYFLSTLQLKSKKR